MSLRYIPAVPESILFPPAWRLLVFFISLDHFPHVVVQKFCWELAGTLSHTWFIFAKVTVFKLDLRFPFRSNLFYDQAYIKDF